MPTAAECLRSLPGWLTASLPHEGETSAYPVGGFVRDFLLGRSNNDVDLAVRGDALALARTIALRAGGTVVPLDPQRGTYRIALRDTGRPLRTVDLTRLRADDIDGDLRRRDFTINAIAIDTSSAAPAFVDPTGGIDDLKRRRIRIAGPGAFEDDPVRLLRAVRFAVQLGFDLDKETAQLAAEASPLIARASPERQRDELAQVLACDGATEGVRMLDRLGLLTRLLPDLEAARGVQQPKEHYYDVFEHSMHTLAMMDLILQREAPAPSADAAFWRAVWDRLGGVPGLRPRLEESFGEGRPRRVALKLVALLHDVSKPETKAIDPLTGKMRFWGHPQRGAGRAEALARQLRFSGREVRYMGLLIHEHLRPGMLAAPGEVPTRRALYRFFRDLGDDCGDLLLLHLADHAAVRGPRLTMQEWTRHVDYARWVLRILYEDDQVARPARLITGNDLMREFNLPPGPLIGRLLEVVYEAQAEGEVTDRAGALLLARAALANVGPGE